LNDTIEVIEGAKVDFRIKERNRGKKAGSISNRLNLKKPCFKRGFFQLFLAESIIIIEILIILKKTK